MTVIKTFLVLLFFLSFAFLSSFSQSNTNTKPAVASSSDMQPKDSSNGVHFEHGLTWQQVKDKARAENKYIFVDFYASWCGPCKLMDKKVYCSDSVGEIINKQFISIKVQCDTSKADQQEVKAWYADAHQMVNEYGITAYPTFLFFTPNGIVVHKGLGYQSPVRFVGLALESLNPGKQYYSLLREYKDGQMEYVRMRDFAGMAERFRDSKLANDIARNYASNYLEKVSDSEFCTEENLVFLYQYRDIITSSDRIFKWCVQHSEQIDSVFKRKGYAPAIISFVAYKEAITPRLDEAAKSKKTPDWDAIGKQIEVKFGQEYAKGDILVAKINWYQSVSDWPNYTKYLVIKYEMDGIENTPKTVASVLGINEAAWNIFLYSTNKAELQKVLGWIDIALQTGIKPPHGNYANMLDTKANLLYKLGRKEEALALEQQATELDPKDKDKKECLTKMQQGKPTWVIY